jgi:hypothetical protein
MNNVATKAPARGLMVNVDTANRKVQLLMLANGHPIEMAAIAFDLEGAMAHVAAMNAAIEAIKLSRSGLLLPPGAGGKPFRP